MENTNTGTMDRSGMMDNVRNQMDNVRNQMSSVSERVSNMMDTDPKSMPRPEHREGNLARTIEQQTAKIPSHYFLFAAVASMGASVAFEIAGNDRMSRFTGMWAPTLMIAGVYNKMVKLQGSDGL